MATSLSVYLHGSPVGRLWLDEQRRFAFQYDPRWLDNKDAIPLSLSLPIQERVFDHDAARPFFANLLPEGDLRRAVTRKLGLSEQNDFALLEAIGGECAGAVSILPEGTSPSAQGEYRPLTEQELHELMGTLPNRPLLAGEEGLRLSLAGAQYKLPVYAEDDRIFLALGAYPSSHILKPPIRDLEGSVANEAFCINLAQAMGLPVPTAIIREGIDALYLVERYDRERGTDGRVRRLHQEDFCQALSLGPDLKYETEGGPSLQACFKLVRNYSFRPAADVNTLLSWVIFNYLIGNADAHAKNLSLLLPGSGPRLAPFYDLLSTTVYPHLAARLAMRIGDEDRPDLIIGRHWEAFATDVEIRWKLLQEKLKSMSEKIVSASRSLAEHDYRDIGVRVAPGAATEFQERHGEQSILPRILEVIEQRSKRTLLNLEAYEKGK
ncbi:MAG: type II toxin-antitoxin system HipA family toxin [Acidiferrobacterales bacterium]